MGLCVSFTPSSPLSAMENGVVVAATAMINYARAFSLSCLKARQAFALVVINLQANTRGGHTGNSRWESKSVNNKIILLQICIFLLKL